MQENSNKAIALNSMILYIRLAITAVSSLFATRFALQALGVNDYGIFSVVGGVISFIAIINTIMVSTSNRFLAIAIGKGNASEINQQFNVNFFVHVALALIILIVSFPLGDWYISHFVNYQGDINTVIAIFYITIIGSAISFVGIPYNGLLMAKERFAVFCLVEILSAIIRFVICYMLLYYFNNKLFVYAVVNSILAAYPTIVFILYCRRKFHEIVKLKLVRCARKYKEVFSFSIWVGFGAVASVGKAQGAALIVNAFFNTVMNTALGLANSVNNILMILSTNVSKSITPQITKSYAAGNMERSEKLVCLSSKVSYLFMLFVSAPFFIDSEFIFKLWLGNIPNYVILFTKLIIVDTLIRTLNSGIPDLVFATGRIKWYQIIESILLLLSVLFGFMVLKMGAKAYSILIIYIIFSFIVFVVRQVLLNKLVHFNNWRLLRYSYLPALLITVLFIPICYINMDVHPIIKVFLSWFYLLLLIVTIGLNKAERGRIFLYIKNKI